MVALVKYINSSFVDRLVTTSVASTIAWTCTNNRTGVESDSGTLVVGDTIFDTLQTAGLFAQLKDDDGTVGGNFGATFSGDLIPDNAEYNLDIVINLSGGGVSLVLAKIIVVAV